MASPSAFWLLELAATQFLAVLRQRGVRESNAGILNIFYLIRFCSLCLSAQDGACAQKTVKGYLDSVFIYLRVYVPFGLC